MGGGGVATTSSMNLKNRSKIRKVRDFLKRKCLFFASRSISFLVKQICIKSQSDGVKPDVGKNPVRVKKPRGNPTSRSISFLF